MKGLHQPLTNAQLEILKVFSFDLNNQELVQFKNLIAQYFAERAIEQANKAWDTNGWNNAKVAEMLDTKMRKSTK